MFSSLEHMLLQQLKSRAVRRERYFLLPEFTAPDIAKVEY